MSDLRTGTVPIPRSNGDRSLHHDRRTTPLRQEIAEIVRPARALIKAHESRNPTSDYATLGEEEALMFLKERINAITERLARRPFDG